MDTKKQDPNEILDYTIDWSESGIEVLLDGESIVTSVWLISGTIELGTGQYAPTQSATACTCWLQSGSEPSDSKVTNRITTDSVPPRIYEHSFIVRTKDK